MQLIIRLTKTYKVKKNYPSVSNEEEEFNSTATWLKKAAVQAKIPAHFSTTKNQ
jgi:hypothetical protein